MIKELRKSGRQRRVQFFLVFSIFIAGLFILILNAYELKWIQQDNVDYNKFITEKVAEVNGRALKYAVFGRDVNSGFLSHVFHVFKDFGYSRVSLNNSDWDVLWAHDYPFKLLYTQLKNMKRHQKVNHFPGSGHITNKMDLATTKTAFVPRAFKIPQQIEELLAYVKKHPYKKFVQKGNEHRGIKILDKEAIDLDTKSSFIQEFIGNPLLIDGYKFDIGVYTVITSIDPLRVYIYNGDMLFRYCTEKYYPLDPSVVNKYVIGDDYLPTWEVPSLKKLYNDLGYSMKDSFNIYLQQAGHNPSKVWEQIEEAIRTVCLKKEGEIGKVISGLFSSKRNFFEMVRFDFVVDRNFNVFIMEANMSPNLSSLHFPPNRLLYEQVLLNLFHLVGLARMMSIKHQEDIEVADKNIVIPSRECPKCMDCNSNECLLCLPCLTPEMKFVLKSAYLEEMNKHDFKRIFPSVTRNHTPTLLEDHLSPENKLMVKWYFEKCKENLSWCSR